jgi:hypothetical protein
MPQVTHLPPDCSTDDLIDLLEQDGAAIVDGFVSDTWLAEFNAAVQTSVDHYTPYDYGALNYLFHFCEISAHKKARRMPGFFIGRGD